MSEDKNTIYNLKEPEPMLVQEPSRLYGGVLQLDESKRYTYADYLRWFDDVRREVINGIIHAMSAPWTKHAKILSRLNFSIALYLHKRQGNCEVFFAPFDVRLTTVDKTTDQEVTSVVQPDILVVCDPSKIDEKGCIGAPDFIVEITSPSTRKRDCSAKLYLYEAAGVKEYWIADQKTDTLHAFVLQSNGKYDVGTIYAAGQQAPVHTLPGLAMDVSALFED
jgi:Uma2 family endonuclease